MEMTISKLSKKVLFGLKYIEQIEVSDDGTINTEKLKVAYGTIPVKAAPHTHDFPSKSYVMAQDAKRASTELKERNKLRAEYQKYPGLWKSMVDKTSTDIRTAFNKEIQDKAKFASEQRNLIRSEYRPKISKLEGEAKDDRANLTSKLAAYDKKIDGLGKKYLKAYIPDNKDYHFQYFKDSPDSYEPTPQEIKDLQVVSYIKIMLPGMDSIKIIIT